MILNKTVWLVGILGAALKTVPRTGKRASPLLHWLVSLGGLGVFAVAIVDSSMIPLPLPGSTELLLLLLCAHRGTTGWGAVGLAACALAGSMVGGYLSWSTGRKGGEVALERYIPRRHLDRVKGWVERHGALTSGVAAILPPPIPLTPFLLAAGALGVRRGRFLVFYGVARAIRFGLLAWLGITYGRRFVGMWQKDLGKYSTPILWTYGGLVAIGIGFGCWKLWRGKKTAGQEQKTEKVA